PDSSLSYSYSTFTDHATHRFFLLIKHRPPRPTLFPYTTLFRSMSRLMASLSPEQRAELRALAEEMLGDMDLAFEVDRLASSLSGDRKSTRLNSSHVAMSYAVFCLKKKKSSSRAHVATTRYHSHH